VNQISRIWKSQVFRYSAVCALVAMLVALCRLLHANSTASGFVLLLAVLAVSST